MNHGSVRISQSTIDEAARVADEHEAASRAAAPDIVERLRSYRLYRADHDLMVAAADEVERLTRQRDNLLAERASLLAATGGLAPAIVARAMKFAADNPRGARDGGLTVIERRALMAAEFAGLS